MFLLFSMTSACGKRKAPFEEIQPGEKVIVEANDAGETITVTKEEYDRLTGEEFHKNLYQFFEFKMSWKTVVEYISPEMERAYDAFIMVNVDTEKNFDAGDVIPAQHMKVIQRTKKDQKLFHRRDGVVVGIRKNIAGNGGGAPLAQPFAGVEGRVSGEGVLEDLMPVSSGAGHFGVDKYGYSYDDTPSGIYRINFERSDTRRRSNHPKYKKSVVMWHSLYFDLYYPGGRESGLAIHGTDRKAYWHLGKRRSHGCIRITQEQANVMYENFINNDQWYSENLPDLDNRYRLKMENGKAKAGSKALIVVFYGYDESKDSFVKEEL